MLYNRNTNRLLGSNTNIYGWMDLEHRVLAANQFTLSLYGYRNIHHLLGKSMFEITDELAKAAPKFHHQNDLVIQNRSSMIVFDVHRYADNELHTFISTKSPLIDEQGKLVGTSYFGTEIKKQSLNMFFSKLLDLNRNVIQGDTTNSYICSNHAKLSEREDECLFLLIRGFSIKLIAKKLGIMPSTAASYIENIKIKFNCRNKFEVIEFAIKNGFVSFIPKSLFERGNISLILSQ